LMEPRWTLMNFYFRGREEVKFWSWARRTFAMSYGDRTPLFDLCWRVREDPTVIESKALPWNYPILFQFAAYLAAKGRLRDAATLAQRILPEASASDIPAYLHCVDQLLKSNDPIPAVSLWNALCERGLLPFGRLNPAVGNTLTNGNFEHDPTASGFDWRLPITTGVTTLRLRNPAEMRLTFNGQQPEACDLLAQSVPLQPSREYRLRFSYRTSGIPAGSGLRLRVLEQTTPDLSSGEWIEQTLRFPAGSHDLGDIVLEYRRPSGFVRVEGTLELRGMTLGFAE